MLCLVLRLLLGSRQWCWPFGDRQRNAYGGAQWNAHLRDGQLAAVSEYGLQCLDQVRAEVLAAAPAAELGMVGIVLRRGKRGVELADGLRHWVPCRPDAANGLSSADKWSAWFALCCYSFRCQAAWPCSQMMLHFPDERSDLYFLLIVNSECC